MNLLPGWQEILDTNEAVALAEQPRIAIPRAPEFYGGQITFVDTPEKAQSMVELAHQLPLAFIGIDSEFKYDRAPAIMNGGGEWRDPRSIHPLLISLSLVESGTSSRLCRFVMDARRPELRAALQKILQMPVCFVGHFLEVELFVLWQMGLREPDLMWDTWVCEKALNLGRYHAQYRTERGASDVEQAQAKEDADQEQDVSFSLVSTCNRYGVEYAMASAKERLQQSFLVHGNDQSFSQEQIEYAAADADAAAKLYIPQVQSATLAGILQHLTTVEMPWVTTNARMIWNGVRVDAEKRTKALQACEVNLPALLAGLKGQGLENPNSHKQLQAFFGAKGLLDAFARKGSYSFDKDQMKRMMHLNPSIKLIRSARRLRDLTADAIMREDLVGADGRLHPDYRQLGTHSGRQTCRWPNVLGLDRVLRPMIVPDPGRAIGEVDLSQIEVGIAAAVYHDDALVQMFNSGDVYSAMAQRFYTSQLSEADRALPGSQFKRTHPKLRDKMKTCTLGIIYGLTPHGLSLYLNVGKNEAAKLQQRFMQMFPSLRDGLHDASEYGLLRGYGTTNTGLKRYRVGTGKGSSWERNWLTNHPVQGSAAVVFKAAGNRLYRLYQQYDAWLTIPFHDAYIFETPAETLQPVAELTQQVLCQTVQEYFPMLRPRADINISRPDCWNKDGKGNAFDRWLEDPQFTI